MLKIRDDIELKELEKFGYMSWDKENAEVVYFKFVPTNAMIIQIIKDRSIDFQLPIGSIIKKEDIQPETFIQDLKDANLVEKVSE